MKRNILFLICVVILLTAQVGRAEDKKEQHASSSRPARVAHVQQSRLQVQNRPQIQRQSMPSFHEQPARQQRQGPRVYAVPASASPVDNNRFLHRQHHNHWQPRYNFYDDQYHFYPYVNIAATVELSSDCVSFTFDGEIYYYDQGTFYQQDAQGQYVAVPPPVGVIVNPIAARARQIIVDGQIYYRYKGVFYVQIAQGYQVVSPVQSVPDAS